MGTHIISGSVTEQGIDNILKQLYAYKRSVNNKTRTAINRLLDIGIETARMNAGEYATYIVFTRRFEHVVDGCTGIMLAYDGQKIISSWRYKGGLKSVQVSPLLMAEFGSGWHAKVLDNVQGVGQGTFPEQKHAFDPNGWWWTDEKGETHHSEGEAPTFPVHAASVAMLMDIEKVFREVFA